MKIRKNTIKYLLDAVMLLFLVLMYNKNAISMSFHEIGGLFLIGLCVIHLLFNGKWISAVTKRLFSKQTPAKIRLGYCVDALLSVAFALIGVSGVLISKELFSLHGGNVWKIVHYFASAVAIVLMGIHLGLHWNMLRMKVLGTNAFKKRGARIAGIAAMCLVLVFGVYSMATTSFVRWFAMPFSAANAQFPSGNGDGEGSGQGAGMGRGKNRVEVETEDVTEQNAADASAPAPGGGNVGGAHATSGDDNGNTISVVGDDGTNASDAVQDGRAGSGAPAADGSGEGKGAPSMDGGGNGEGMPARDGGGIGGASAPGSGEFRGEGHGEQASVLSTLLLIANYLSITVLFAAITRGIELFMSRRVKNLPVGNEK